MNLRIVLTTAFVLLAGLGAGAYVLINAGVSIAQTAAYAPPETREGDDGWMSYIDAPEIGPQDAAGLNPAPASPEAAVVKFLASRMRGDAAWQDALVAERSGRLERQIAKWQDWQVDGFQLRGRKPTRGEGVYIKVFFRLTIDGDSDSGTDEFEVIPDGSEWRVASIPT